MKTSDGTEVAPEVSVLDRELEQVTEAMQSDGPDGALVILMAHRDGRVTLRSGYTPTQVASWLYELAVSIAQEYPHNSWPIASGRSPEVE